MNDVFEYKNIAIEGAIKDIDTEKGIIVGHFSKFGNVDSDGDMIMPGAFSKSLQENYNRLKHLYQHDPFKPLSGTKKGHLVMKEDKDGLYFESKVTGTSWGTDAIKLHIDGVIDENSIGFKTIKSIDRKSYKELTELALWEGSAVTWGANSLAQTTGMKSMFSPESIIKKMDNVIKAIRNGKYENEEIFDQLEIYLKQLQQLFINLTKTTTEPEITTQPEIKEDNVLTTLNNYYKSLKESNSGTKRINPNP
jgi:HK97 family phage prohead protease